VPLKIRSYFSEPQDSYMPKASTTSSAAAATSPLTVNLPTSYEAALKELESLVAQLESGQMPLDQLLMAYQRGAVLLQFCRDRLASVEQQVSLLDKGALSAWKPE
jgi:exodeoxyribonuclease VII small subunit